MVMLSKIMQVPPGPWRTKLLGASSPKLLGASSTKLLPSLQLKEELTGHLIDRLDLTMEELSSAMTMAEVLEEDRLGVMKIHGVFENQRGAKDRPCPTLIRDPSWATLMNDQLGLTMEELSSAMTMAEVLDRPCPTTLDPSWATLTPDVVATTTTGCLSLMSDKEFTKGRLDELTPDVVATTTTGCSSLMSDKELTKGRLDKLTPDVPTATTTTNTSDPKIAHLVDLLMDLLYPVPPLLPHNIANVSVKGGSVVPLVLIGLLGFGTIDTVYCSGVGQPGGNNDDDKPKPPRKVKNIRRDRLIYLRQVRRDLFLRLILFLSGDMMDDEELSSIASELNNVAWKLCPEGGGLYLTQELDSLPRPFYDPARHNSGNRSTNFFSNSKHFKAQVIYLREKKQMASAAAASASTGALGGMGMGATNGMAPASGAMGGMGIGATGGMPGSVSGLMGGMPPSASGAMGGMGTGAANGMATAYGGVGASNNGMGMGAANQLAPPSGVGMGSANGILPASGAMGGLGMGAANGLAPAYGGTGAQPNGDGGMTPLPLMNHGNSGTQGPFSAPPAPVNTPNPSPYGLSAGSTPLNSSQSIMSDPPTQGFLLGLERTGDFNPTLENQQALGRFQQEQNAFFAHAEATRQSRDNRHYQHHLERQQLLQHQQHVDATEAESFRITSFQRDLSAVIFLQANPTFGLRPILADHSQPAAQNLGPTFEHVAGQNTPSNGPSNGGVPPTGSQLPAMGGQATWGSRGAVPTTPAPGHGSFPSTIQGASQSYRTPAPRSASSAPGRQVHGLSSNLFGSASASGAGGQDSSAGVAGNGPSASSAPSFAAPSFAAPSTVMQAPAPSVSGAATSQSGFNLANSRANSSVATGNAVVSRPVWVPPAPAAAAVPSTNHAQTSGAGILTAPAPANAMEEDQWLPSTNLGQTSGAGTLVARAPALPSHDLQQLLRDEQAVQILLQDFLRGDGHRVSMGVRLEEAFGSQISHTFEMFLSSLDDGQVEALVLLAADGEARVRNVSLTFYSVALRLLLAEVVRRHPQTRNDVLWEIGGRLAGWTFNQQDLHPDAFGTFLHSIGIAIQNEDRFGLLAASSQPTRTDSLQFNTEEEDTAITLVEGKDKKMPSTTQASSSVAGAVLSSTSAPPTQTAPAPTSVQITGASSSVPASVTGPPAASPLPAPVWIPALAAAPAPATTTPTPRATPDGNSRDPTTPQTPVTATPMNLLTEQISCVSIEDALDNISASNAARSTVASSAQSNNTFDSNAATVASSAQSRQVENAWQEPAANDVVADDAVEMFGQRRQPGQVPYGGNDAPPADSGSSTDSYTARSPLSRGPLRRLTIDSNTKIATPRLKKHQKK